MPKTSLRFQLLFFPLARVVFQSKTSLLILIGLQLILHADWQRWYKSVAYIGEEVSHLTVVLSFQLPGPPGPAGPMVSPLCTVFTVRLGR